MNAILLIAAILGFVSVAFGAYSEHGLRPKVDAETFRSVMTAVRYNQIYSALLFALGLLFYADIPSEAISRLYYVAGGFTLGCVLFCFSIYLWAYTGIKALSYAAPFGGILFMLSWLAAIWAALAPA